MNSEFYLPRTLRKLQRENSFYDELELIAASNFIVILAEPGGGKTRLLTSLATKLGTKPITANVFIHTTPNSPNTPNTPLVIDAFDELAKLGPSGINQLLGRATGLSPSFIILSSRSSEWNNAYTHNWTDFFGHTPLVVQIIPFREHEQQQIFQNYVPNENFTAFQNEIARFDLEPLLPNPQFLKLFTDAYIESGRQFTSKNSIFKLAIERLAREYNQSVNTPGNLPFASKINLAEEVFAKLLLSGSEGISLSDINSDRLYPQLTSLIPNQTQVESILATQLFKPGDHPDQHHPVHKIVSEYCAAQYLVKQLSSARAQLSLPQCLSIIAPNSAVRDDLRGLLGWMAALGNKQIQEAAIDLDPYAVIANGDPSRLLTSSKKRLLQKLQKLAEDDPYFRRSDTGREFSVGDFFASDVVDELKILLTKSNVQGHLLSLILELLAGSKTIPSLTHELQELTLAPHVSKYIRLLANERLMEDEKHDHRANLSRLLTEASTGALEVATAIIHKLGPNTFEKPYLASFLRICAALYPSHQKRFESVIGERRFIKNFIAGLDLEIVQWLLNGLTHDLTCTCGQQPDKGDCRNGISKIVGSLLDRFFELSPEPFDPSKIWEWVQNLNFHEGKNPDQSLAIRILREDDTLRQGIIKLVFEQETDQSRIQQITNYKFNNHCHSGLYLQIQDQWFIINLAFNADNTDLWSFFIKWHQGYLNPEDRGPNKLRRYMRIQAQKKQKFMQVWSKSNRKAKETEYQHRLMWRNSLRRARKQRKQKNKINKQNAEYLLSNHELIKSGRHWGFLTAFARQVLHKLEKIEHKFDETLVSQALHNCLDFIEPHIPNLQKLAELHCRLERGDTEEILYAACLEKHRKNKNLNGISKNLLIALKTHRNIQYRSVTEAEQNALRREINSQLFPDTKAAEKFLRDYVEVQLSMPDCMNPQVEWLQYDEAFMPFKSSLPIEWLTRFNKLPIRASDELFEMAAQFGERQALEELIVKRCEVLTSSGPETENDETLKEQRNFWLLRAFYFLPKPTLVCLEWLKTDKNLLLRLDERSSSINYHRGINWPTFSSIKIEAILDAFIDTWPKVNLPSGYGSDSPDREKAYRFLTNIIWGIEQDDPDASSPVLDRLLQDQRHKDFYPSLKHIRSTQAKKKALKGFNVPEPAKIVALLDQGEIATVKGLRALLVEELQIYQADLDGHDLTTKDIFYANGEHLGEVEATQRIAERLRLRLEHKDITITAEHQLKDEKRCDFTCTKMFDNRRRLLVVEVKGQWHKELYSAASKQLSERYAIHPDAEHQGVYLVLWFGKEEKVADKKGHDIESPQKLKEFIETKMPTELKNVIDVFVLDVSKG